MSRPAPDASVLHHAEARAWATHWAQRWFVGPDGRDRFRVGTTDAGWATHVEAYLLLLDVAGATSRRRLTLPAPAGWLKAHGFDRAIRAGLLRRVTDAPLAPASVAVVAEIPTPSMLGPATRVARAAHPGVAVAVADPRAARRLRREGLAPHALTVARAEERRLLTGARTGLGAAWDALRAAPPEMPLGDRDLAHAALERLGPLVRRSMPYLAPETAAIERFLDATAPAGVAIASDQHRIGRLVVAAARARGIRSVVLQHGLPQSRIGYLPVVADAVAAWSPASRDWFVDGGTAPDRVVVTGNPRADALATTSPVPSGPQHVVLALSPTAQTTNELLVRDVVASLDALPGARLTIKLHPGQGDWSFVGGIVRGANDPGRVAVLRHEPLYPLLASASVVVVHRSSVAVEAMVARRPVIVHRAGGEPTTADLELADLDLRVTERALDLAAAVDELSRSVAADAYLAARATQLERIAGPLDGRSTERIVTLVRDGILGA